MSAPLGLGWWIAFESAMHPGGKEKDLEVAVERCLSTGATWVAMRAGDGSANDRDANEQSVRAFKDAGLGVYPWIFARPNRIAQETAGYKRFMDYGADGVIINAEFEYVHVSAADATRLVETIRKAGVDFVAHAPPDYAGSTNANPWNALDAACDAIMPQVYAWEHDDRGHVHHLNNVRARYVAKRTPVEKVWPILCSYRPKVRGFTKEGKSIPTPLMQDEAERVARDLMDGLTHAWCVDSQAPSIYSLDAITFINGANDRVMPTLMSAYAQGKQASVDAERDAILAEREYMHSVWHPKSANLVMHELGLTPSSGDVVRGCDDSTGDS